MRNLFKAMMTTGGATLVAQVLGLVSNKILALHLGTAGIGFYSLMRQVHDTATSLGSVGAGGLAQGLAGREGAARLRLLRAAILLSSLGALVAMVLLFAAPGAVAELLFDSTDGNGVAAIAICGATVVLGIAWTTLGAVLGAARAIAALALVGIAGALATALLAWPVALVAGTRPYLLALLIGAPLLLQLAAGAVVLGRSRFIDAAASGAPARPGNAEFRYFAGFFGYNILMGAIATGAILLVRAGIVHRAGLDAAGLFAAGWGIGMQSMAVILSAFSLYVVPTLAADTPEQRRRTLQDTATLIMSLTLPALAILLVFKALVVRILFSDEFLPTVALLQWVLLGNYLKALGWVLAVPLLATADLRRLFPLEAGWYVLFAAGTTLALQRPDWLSGIGIAFVAAYAVYIAAGGWLTWRRFGFRPSRRFLAVFAAGGLTLGATAVATWNETFTRWPLAVAVPVAACLVALLGLTPQQRQKIVLYAVSMGRL
ncbi:MAG: hypothetical protein AB7R90_06205 [Reyranellaceae bacterium]